MLLCTGNAYAMDHAMQQIIHWKQMKPAEGKIIAYSTGISSLDSTMRYSLFDLAIKYAYVAPYTIIVPNREGCDKNYKGYPFRQLLKTSIDLDEKYLINANLAQGNFFMRQVNPQEAREILSAIQLGHAGFGYNSGYASVILSKLEEIAQQGK
jgi:hypothetical protein